MFTVNPCTGNIMETKRTKHTVIAMFLVTLPIVINVPTRGLLGVKTMHAIVQWLVNLNIKRNVCKQETSLYLPNYGRERPRRQRVNKYIFTD